MKASVATATTVLLGPRLEVSDKQLFREMKKTSKAERDKNGKMARSNPTSAARYSLKTKCRSWERNPPTGVASCWDLSGTKGPMTQTSVTTKHLRINIFLKVPPPLLAFLLLSARLPNPTFSQTRSHHME